METSDSECFESADEDIYSDDEATESVRTNINKLDIKVAKKDKTHTNLPCEEPVNIGTDENENKNTVNQPLCNKNDNNFHVKQKDILDAKITSKVIENSDVVDTEIKKIVQKGSDQKEQTVENTETKELESTHIDNTLWEETDWGQEADKELEHENAKTKLTKELGQHNELPGNHTKPNETSPHIQKINVNKHQDKNKKDEPDSETNLWDDDEELGQHNELPGNNTKPSETSRHIEKINVNKHQDKNKKDDPDSETNLWGDDEIDWEVEGNKEEENSKTVKIQDNSEDKWEDDDWEPIHHDEPNTKSIIIEPSNSNSWGAWGNWGVSSILSTASQGVSTLTSHVSHGITTVLESGMGVPEPEEMARINRSEKDQYLKEHTLLGHERDTTNFGLGNFGNLVSGVSHLTKFVESTSNKVISGGLDTLETIGKKTMEVLQDGDPGLKKKRAFLKLDTGKPVLSQVLREAKEKAEKENKQLEQKHVTRRQKNYELLFDDHQGLVHLEALEMLSKLCTMKLQNTNESLTGDALIELQETMEQVKELCELPEDEEDEHLTLDEIKEKLDTAIKEINIPISYDKLISTWEETDIWLNNTDTNFIDENELHQQAIENLAQLTAIAVEQFHKAGELLLVKDHRSTADEADSLVQLTINVKALILIVANKFTEKLNAISSDTSKKKQINDLITNVFFEAANSSSYIQDAFQLLIPVLQVGAV